MKSVTTERFRKAYSLLPRQIKDSTQKTYRKWKENPNHPSLQFKQISKPQAIYSVRISLSYRASWGKARKCYDLVLDRFAC